jgi:hypothetical protein
MPARISKGTSSSGGGSGETSLLGRCLLLISGMAASEEVKRRESGGKGARLETWREHGGERERGGVRPTKTNRGVKGHYRRILRAEATSETSRVPDRLYEYHQFMIGTAGDYVRRQGDFRGQFAARNAY